MSSPFDRALERRELIDAAEAYASRRGVPGSSAYRAALVDFRRRIRTSEDLSTLRSELLVGRRVIDVLTGAIEHAKQIDGAQMGNAQLFEAYTRGLRLVAQSGFTSDFLEFFSLVDDTASACGSALSTGQPVWVPDITRSPIFHGTRGLQVMLDAGSRAVASLPVTTPGGQLIGVISVHHGRPTSWTDERRLELDHFRRTVGQRLHSIMRTERANSA